MDIETIVLAAQAGGREATRALANWLFTTLGDYFSACFATQDTNELRQRSMEVIIREFPRFESRGPSSFRSWVLKIATYEAKTLRRDPIREQHNLAKLAHALPPSTRSPASKLHLLELGELLEQGLARLPHAEREAVVWGLEERDDHELAARHELTVRAIRTRRFRGRQKLIAHVRAALRTPALSTASSSSR